jgi:hydroxymethylpyrimidine/phosphomethylpyrimidine kinase
MPPAPMPSEPVILTIAGFDPMGGAGVIADLKTFAAHGCYGVAAITAIYPENPSATQDFYPVEPRVLQSCLASVLAGAGVRTVKIGLLATRAHAETAAKFLETNPSLPVVLDPLVCSKSRPELIDSAGLEFVRDCLLRQATVITPNLLEAAALTGLRVENVEQMKAAADKLIQMGARAVVVTGGHLERPVDVFAQGSIVQSLAGDPVKPQNIYGAACAFSSALAANLAQGRELAETIVLAKAFVTESIKKAHPVGPGRVPLNHLYRMQAGQRSADVPATAASR